MTIKKIVAQLQKHITIKFPEYDAKFYANRHNYYIHLGLDKSLFSFENYKKILTEINNYLNEHLHSQFKSIFHRSWCYQRSGSTIRLFIQKFIMAKVSKMAWQVDNTFVSPYVPESLKWFERDGLETWYRQKKCREFLEDTDSHFQQRQIINFDMIRNSERLDKKRIKQYHQIDPEEI